MRRTEVRPMLSRREISNLFSPEPYSFLILPACIPAVKGRLSRLPICRA
jgi:hypothetical protein